MPCYDRRCTGCAWQAIDVFEPVYLQAPVCPLCGAVTQRAWLSKPPAVIGDEIPGGFVQENFGVQPETFYSKSSMARRAKELGLMPLVRHVGEQGSDKSKHTTRWV
jgi:hypothetical protein